MKVLLTGAYPYTEEQLKKIRALDAELFFLQEERAELPCSCAEIDLVVCNGLFLYHDISQFTRLKLVQVTSAGLDRVPLDYIRANHIALFNARGVYSIPMAEWIVLKVMELYKHSKAFYSAQNKKQWSKDRALLELYGKTACIVGAGSIGIETAKRLKAFGVNVTAVDAADVPRDYIDRLYPLCEIETALAQSDITILTLPLTEQTAHMFSKPLFDKMKDGSILINVARGAVLSEKDLTAALVSGKLSGAALDVFEKEPLDKKSPLWNMENVIITPHNSFVSDNASARLFDLIYENLKENM